MTTPRDAIGLSDRLRQMPSSLNDACRTMEEAATKLESLAKALREPEAEWKFCPECGSMKIHHEKGRHKQCGDCFQEWFSDMDYSDVVQAHLGKNYCDSREAIKKAESRATSAEQERDKLQGMLLLCGELGGIGKDETPVAYLRRLIDGLIDAARERDEAYERAAKVADKKADDLLVAAASLGACSGATKLAYTEADLHEQAGAVIRALAVAIRRLTAGTEEEGE